MNDNILRESAKTEKSEYDRGWKEGYKHGAWASKPEPQAQAGEPEVVALRWSWYDDADGLFYSDIIEAPGGGMQETETYSFIALQSHREAIAKKDAALKACVEVLKFFKEQATWGPNAELAAAAITQAQEALK